VSFPLPTLEDVHGFLVADFYNTFRHLEPDVSEGSFNWLWLRTFAAGVTGNHAHIKALETDLLPDTAEGELLRRWAKIRGVTPKGATSARKAKALRFFGTASTAVPTGALLTHSSQLAFLTASADVIGPGGYVDVDVVAVDVGSATRLNAGEELTLATPIAGLSDTAKLVLDLDEDGSDAELDGDLQKRVAKRFSDPPRGGSIADYVAWATDVAGIHEAFVYPVRKGWGNVDVTALHKATGSARMLSAPEVADLYNAIDKKRPVGMKGWRLLATTAESVDVEHTVIPNGDPEFAKDWDDATPPTVAAWDSVTRELEFSARPASMKAGDRVVFAAGATCRERIVDALGTGDTVILKLDLLGDVPTVASVVYSGGPLVQPIRAAILAHIGSLGTANPDSKRYGSWEGNLRPNAIGRVAGSVAGYLDGTTIAPATVQEATNPTPQSDDPIGLIVPGKVLVRYAV
jgi:uncharacterized phage protein gp47/JayE